MGPKSKYIYFFLLIQQGKYFEENISRLGKFYLFCYLCMYHLSRKENSL